MTTASSAPPDLFESDGGDTTTLVAIAGSRPTLNKAQREFNTLTGRIRRLRDALADWQAYRQRFAERWAQELAPRLTALRRAETDLVRRIDALLCHPPTGVKFGRRQRQTLIEHLLFLVDHLLAVESDAELEALHDRHSEVSREDQRAMERDFTHAMLGEVFGEDVAASLTGDDAETLLRQAQAKLADDAAAEADARQQRAAARGTKGGKPTAAARAAERQAAAAQQASQSLREVFRKLASALHPDREADGAERERKTTLMKRVNQAYQREDLLELLALQIEVAQVDLEHLAALPEPRLRHYNHLLKEQIRTLEDELDALATPLLQEFGLNLAPDPRCLGLLDGELNRRIAAVRSLERQHHDDLSALDDPKRRRQLLDQLAAEQRAADRDAAGDPFDVVFGEIDRRPKRRR